MKYPNLEAEIARGGLTKQEVADTIGVSRNTFYRWMNGDTDFPLDKAKAVSRTFFPSCDFGYLFESANDGDD